MLILADSARRGFTRDVESTWDLAPGARELPKFLDVERKVLLGLGLGRRARRVPDLSQYLDDPSKPWNQRARGTVLPAAVREDVEQHVAKGSSDAEAAKEDTTCPPTAN